MCDGQVRHGEGCVATRAFAEGEVCPAVICTGDPAVICMGESAVICMDVLDVQVVLQELPALGLQTPPSRVQVRYWMPAAVMYIQAAAGTCMGNLQ